MSNTSSVHNVTRLVKTDVHVRHNDDGGWITISVKSEFGSMGSHETDFTFFSENVPELAQDLLRSLEEQISMIR